MLALAEKYLLKDPLFHTDMLEVLRRGTAQVVFADSEGVLLFDRVARLFLLSAQTEAAGAQLVAHITNPVLVTVHQPFLVNQVAKAFSLRPIMTCFQAVWPESEPPIVPPSPLVFRLLPLSMADEVYALYSHETDIAYIRDRLSNNAVYGAYWDGTLAGFCGFHPEGSMGLIEVTPAFQRKGIGLQMLAFLCKEQLAKGRVPFSQFVIENEASHKLHMRSGFAISKSTIYWLEK